MQNIFAGPPADLSIYNSLKNGKEIEICVTWLISLKLLAWCG